MKTETEAKIENATLALMLLGLHDMDRAWKGFDWQILDRLHEKGLISNPKNKYKSVSFSTEGLMAAKTAHKDLFGEEF
jgi:hypothetical protein